MKSKFEFCACDNEYSCAINTCRHSGKTINVIDRGLRMTNLCRCRLRSKGDDSKKALMVNYKNGDGSPVIRFI